MKQFGSHPGRTDPGALSTTACEDGPLIPEKDGPLTPEIAINPIIITTARSLSIESGFLTDETNEQILQKAHAQAQNIAAKLPADKPDAEAVKSEAPEGKEATADKPDAEPAKADAPADKPDAEPAKADAPADKPDAE